MTVRPLKLVVSAAVLALGLCAAPALAAVERAIVISIDGIRSSEGFGDPDCQDQPGGDGTCWLPNLKSLLPSGTLYTREPSSPATGSAFLNDAAAWTVPGHTMLLTGVRDIEPNTRGDLDLRPFRPTLFERARARVPALTADDVVGVVSKTHMTRLDYSTDPAHGSPRAGKFYIVPAGQALAAEDIEVATKGRCLMQGLVPSATEVACSNTSVVKPRLLFLHFGGVDHQGHVNPGPEPEDGFYDDTIRQVDQQIFTKVWSELCDLPTAEQCLQAGKNPDFRRNNTALFITTDHGRESFTVREHGGLDWANRALFFLGVGPGIQAGQVFTSKVLPSGNGLGCSRRASGGWSEVAVPCRQQEDLAPTVASILELQPGVTATVPDAEGVVMAEMFSGAAPPPFALQRSEPRVVAANGSLHVVWSERRAVTGERDIWYQRLNPAGITSFTIPAPPPQPAPIKLSLPTDAEGRRLTALQPHIFAATTRVHVVYSTTRSLQESGDNLADIYVTGSVDGGNSFTAPERVGASVVETGDSPFPVAYFAPATVLEQSGNGQIRRWAFANRLFSRVVGIYADPGAGWREVRLVPPQPCDESLAVLEVPSFVCPGQDFFAQRMDTAVQGNRVEVAWQAVNYDERWDVVRAENTLFGSPDAWTVTDVTSTSDGVTSLAPGMGFKGNTLNVLWGDNADAAWKVRGSRASSAVSGDNAFLPDVAAKDSNIVYAAYSRINPATLDYDIYWNRSNTGGTSWLLETRLPVTSPEPSLYPSVTYDNQGDHTWVVWREGNGPNWTVKGQRIE
jgi:hypothetical protein